MNIVFFTAVRFDSMISGRTKQLAAEIAAIGHDVWFVEMPSLRNLRFPPLQVSKRCRINVITLPPFPMSHKLINTPLGAGWRKVVVAFLQKQFSNFQDVHCIVSNPWWEHLLNGKPFGSLSYDYIDHVSVHCQKKHEKKMRDWEKKLLDNCDNIFIVRDTLKNEIQNSTAKQILLVPNGVPADWLSIKSDMSSGTQRPRIGFVGYIYEWIDQKLICSVAKACPDLNFILAGPTRREVSVELMKNMENITLQAPITFDEVPERIQSFDVCMIPFKNDVVSNYADPLKLYEYLAMGKPVVTSVDFNKDAPVYTAANATEFALHIRAALNEKDRSREYRGFASEHTWLKRARRITMALCRKEQQC